MEKWQKSFPPTLEFPLSHPVCVHETWFNIGNCLLYLAIYYHFSLEGPLAFKSAAGCLIAEDSLLGPLNCSPRTMDSFVDVFLFLSLDNTRGSFWLCALKKCLQNYTSLYASQNKYKSVGCLVENGPEIRFFFFSLKTSVNILKDFPLLHFKNNSPTRLIFLLPFSHPLFWNVQTAFL